MDESNRRAGISVLVEATYSADLGSMPSVLLIPPGGAGDHFQARPRLMLGSAPLLSRH